MIHVKEVPEEYGNETFPFCENSDENSAPESGMLNARNERTFYSKSPAVRNNQGNTMLVMKKRSRSQTPPKTGSITGNLFRSPTTKKLKWTPLSESQICDIKCVYPKRLQLQKENELPNKKYTSILFTGYFSPQTKSILNEINHTANDRLMVENKLGFCHSISKSIDNLKRYHQANNSKENTSENIEYSRNLKSIPTKEHIPFLLTDDDVKAFTKPNPNPLLFDNCKVLNSFQKNITPVRHTLHSQSDQILNCSFEEQVTNKLESLNPVYVPSSLFSRYDLRKSNLDNSCVGDIIYRLPDIKKKEYNELSVTELNDKTKVGMDEILKNVKESNQTEQDYNTKHTKLKCISLNTLCTSSVSAVSDGRKLNTIHALGNMQCKDQIVSTDTLLSDENFNDINKKSIDKKESDVECILVNKLLKNEVNGSPRSNKSIHSDDDSFIVLSTTGYESDNDNHKAEIDTKIEQESDCSKNVKLISEMESDTDKEDCLWSDFKRFKTEEHALPCKMGPYPIVNLDVKVSNVCVKNENLSGTLPKANSSNIKVDIKMTADEGRDKETLSDLIHDETDGKQTRHINNGNILGKTDTLVTVKRALQEEKSIEIILDKGKKSKGGESTALKNEISSLSNKGLSKGDTPTSNLVFTNPFHLSKPEIKTIRPETEFISKDPAENADNFDPKWEALRLVGNDVDMYKQIRKRWRNLCIPNPNVDLTFRHQRCNTNVQPSNNTKNLLQTSQFQHLARKHTLSENKSTAETIIPQHARSKSCSVLYDTIITQAENEARRMRLEVESKNQFEMSCLNRTQDMERRTTAAVFTMDPYVRENTLQILRIHQNQERVCMLAKHQNDMQEIENQKQRIVQLFKKYKTEVEDFTSFYQSMCGTNHSDLLISDEQYEHLAETERMYSLYSNFYSPN